MKKIFPIVLLSLIFLTAVSFAGRLKDVTEVVEIETAKKVELRGELGAGTFTIQPKKLSEAAKFEISYNPRRVEYYIDSKIKRNICYIDIDSEQLKKYNINSEENIWDINLSTEYPIILDLEIGACEAEFELGGLSLEGLSLEVGAAAGVIEFSEPNSSRCEEIEIDAGASSVEMVNIGNANFSYFSFDGGVGSFNLDFRGEYSSSAEIDIDIGLGSAEIILPKNVAVRVDTDDDGWFSSVEIHARSLDEIDDGVYESDDFEDAEIQITLTISVGMGSINIYRK